MIRSTRYWSRQVWNNSIRGSGVMPAVGYVGCDVRWVMRQGERLFTFSNRSRTVKQHTVSRPVRVAFRNADCTHSSRF